MAWIKSDQALRQHPKLHRLMKELGVEKVKAVGHMHMLWWWVMDYAPNGDTSGFGPDEIAAGAEWPGDAGVFYQALKNSRFMDQDGSIHDWMEFSGKLEVARKSNAQRQKTYREKHFGNLSSTPAPEREFPEAEKPTWQEFWDYCQSMNCGLTAEWYARDKFNAAAQKNWKDTENWRAYANRVKGWWESDGKPMQPTSHKGSGAAKPKKAFCQL